MKCGSGQPSCIKGKDFPYPVPEQWGGISAAITIISVSQEAQSCCSNLFLDRNLAGEAPQESAPALA